MQPVYVFATVGESPAVVTELLWWLGVHEKTPVFGIELWGTGRGAERLCEAAASPHWEALGEAIGPRLPGVRRPDRVEAPSAGVQLYTFGLEDRVLDDVRTREEANAVARALYDRLRDLRTLLPHHVRLVASLAGGRKTVSSALQTAFSMHARQGDRLVHVVPDARLEPHLREFWFPSEQWEQATGLPPERQISVHDIAVPRLRLLATPSVTDALRLDWDAVWPDLDANARRQVVATLEQTDTTWRLTVRDAESQAIIGTCTPSPREGAVMAALVALDSPNNLEILKWLDDEDAGWKPPVRPKHPGRKDPKKRRENIVSKAVHSLKERLEQDIPPGISSWRLADREAGLPSVPLSWSPLDGS